MPNYLCFRKKDATKPPGLAPPILDWPTANKQMPWSVIILLGGGFALADACKESGLSGVIGAYLSELKFLSPWIIVMIMCLVATTITSFTSNMATTTIMIPILAEVASSTCVNPIYLMLPVTLASSWAYILPVSTPPNAIAHSYGDIAIIDMIKAGLVMCVLCNVVLLFSINTWGYSFFNLGEFPAWAVSATSNCTAPGYVGTIGLNATLPLIENVTSLFTTPS
jgi:sodium-dependent dicarboxylate transporter 2/3/5